MNQGNQTNPETYPYQKKEPRNPKQSKAQAKQKGKALGKAQVQGTAH